MSIRLPLALVSAAVLVGISSGVAVADPPALNRDECAVALGQAGTWPGSMSDDDGGSIRLVSDAFDRHLSNSSACAPAPTTR